jgi:hypothetical protein
MPARSSFGTPTPQRELTREEVRAHWCPRCLAQPGQRCKGRRVKQREANHMDRVTFALEECGMA